MQPELPSPRLFRPEDGATAASLQSLLQQLADLATDGEPLRIVLDYRGHHVELTSGPVAPVEPVKISESDKTVLQAVAELPEAPTGSEIARKSGYSYDSHLKMRLSSLRQRGLLGGEKCETGYPLTPEGWAAIGELVNPTPAPEPPITSTERRILRAIGDSKGESPTGEEVAVLAKLPYEANLRKLLSAMRAKGLLAGAKGEAGYSLTPKARAALEPPQSTME